MRNLEEEILQVVTDHPGWDAEDVSDFLEIDCFEAVDIINKMLIKGLLERDI